MTKRWLFVVRDGLARSVSVWLALSRHAESPGYRVVNFACGPSVRVSAGARSDWVARCLAPVPVAVARFPLRGPAQH